MICCFGEIDIRAHVVKQMTRSNSSTYVEIVDNIIARYVKYLNFIKKCNKRVIAWAPVASVSDTVGKRDSVYGTELQRNEITKYFTKMLYMKCRSNGIEVMSILNDLVDEYGRTKTEYYSEDGIHLNIKAMKFAKPIWKEKNLISDFQS